MKYLNQPSTFISNNREERKNNVDINMSYLGDDQEHLDHEEPLVGEDKIPSIRGAKATSIIISFTNEILEAEKNGNKRGST